METTVGFRGKMRRGIIFSLWEYPEIIFRTLTPIIREQPVWKEHVDSIYRRAESNGGDMVLIFQEFTMMGEAGRMILYNDWEGKKKKKGVDMWAWSKRRRFPSLHFMTPSQGSEELTLEARTQQPWRNKGGAMSPFDLHQRDSRQLCVNYFLASAIWKPISPSFLNIWLSFS